MAAGVVAAAGGKDAAPGITRSRTSAPAQPGRRQRSPGWGVSTAVLIRSPLEDIFLGRRAYSPLSESLVKNGREAN